MKFIRVIKSSLLNENSLGEPIADNEQTLQNFWSWFDGSKIVDEKGRPLVVYHGTNSKFDTFSIDKIGDYKSKVGGGFYFTNDIRSAKSYGNVMSTYLSIKSPLNIYLGSKNISKSIRKSFYNLLKEYGWSKDGFRDYSENADDMMFLHGLYYDLDYKVRNNKYLNSIIKILKIDGIIHEVNSNLKEYIVFSPNQIKSISNNTNYSLEDNSIYGSKL